MPYIDIEATRHAARRVADAGTDVEGACRDTRWDDAAAELQGSMLSRLADCCEAAETVRVVPEASSARPAPARARTPRFGSPGGPGADLRRRAA